MTTAPTARIDRGSELGAGWTEAECESVKNGTHNRKRYSRHDGLERTTREEGRISKQLGWDLGKAVLPWALDVNKAVGSQGGIDSHCAMSTASTDTVMTDDGTGSTSYGTERSDEASVSDSVYDDCEDED